jgi:hypothetical protein
MFNTNKINIARGIPIRIPIENASNNGKAISKAVSHGFGKSKNNIFRQ